MAREEVDDSVNVAVTLLAAVILTLQTDPITLVQPDQLVKDEPVEEEVERSTSVPEL